MVTQVVTTTALVTVWVVWEVLLALQDLMIPSMHLSLAQESLLQNQLKM